MQTRNCLNGSHSKLCPGFLASISLQTRCLNWWQACAAHHTNHPPVPGGPCSRDTLWLSAVATCIKSQIAVVTSNTKKIRSTLKQAGHQSLTPEIWDRFSPSEGSFCAACGPVTATAATLPPASCTQSGAIKLISKSCVTSQASPMPCSCSLTLLSHFLHTARCGLAFYANRASTRLQLAACEPRVTPCMYLCMFNAYRTL